jgi:type I restriction enzyme S subunit
MLKKKLPIGEISYAESSSVSQQSITVMPDGDYPVFGAEGFIKKIQKFEQKEAYIAIIKDGSGVGRTSLLPPESTVIGTLNYIKPKEGIDLNYLYQAFKSLNFKKYIVGSGIPHIYFNDYKVMEVPVPDYENQKKLGSFLSAIDRLIEKQKDKIDLIKSMKKGYLQKMFPLKIGLEPNLRFIGYGEKWITCELKKLAIFNPKSLIPGTFNYVDLESVQDTRLLGTHLEVRENAPSRAQRVAKQGDVFFQIVRPYQKNNYFFELSDQNYVFSTGYAQLRPRGVGTFLFTLIQNQRFVNEVIDNCTGTSYPAINSNDLAKILVSAPIIEKEQVMIGSFFKKLTQLIEKEQDLFQSYNQLKKSHLQAIFAK